MELVIDEVQYVPEAQLAALTSALRRARQKQLPVTMIAAGLPQLIGRMGRAKSYAERLFEFVAIGLLDNVSARDAICLPIEREGETIEDIALSAIVDRTQGYPYFFQEWEKHSWDAADIPCHRGDVDSATRIALAEAMSVKVSSVAPTRNNLIAKGMLYSPAHGDTAFTVPLLDAFMRRVMPNG